MNKKTKKTILRVLLITSSILGVTLSLLVFSPPVWEFCQRELGGMEERRILKIMAQNQLVSPSYEIEARITPDFVTIKCLIEFEAIRETDDAQPFFLHRGFNFDSIKCNQQNLKFERWFNKKGLTFWKVYLPEVERGEKIQLFLVYSGKLPACFRSSGIYSWPAEFFWYPQIPGMIDGGISLQCLVDKEWRPTISELALNVTSIADGTDLYLFSLQAPVSLTFYRTNELSPVEWEDDGYKYIFYDNLSDKTLSTALQEKTWSEIFPYFREQIGETPIKTRVLLFTEEDPPSSGALYEIFVNMGKKKAALVGDASPSYGEELSALIQGIARSWWGGQFSFDLKGGVFLKDGLADYLAYLATKELIGPEEADRIRQGWYEGYLTAIKKYGRRQKALAEIRPVLDRQKPLASDKAPLVWRSLHHLLGDKAFFGLAQKIYRQYAGETISLDDLRKEAEESSGIELGWFFAYFLSSASELDLWVEEVTSSFDGEAYLSAISVRGADSGEEFLGGVDLRIQTANETTVERLEFTGKSMEFTLSTASPVLAVYLDPEERWPDINRENNEWRMEEERTVEDS